MNPDQLTNCAARARWATYVFMALNLCLSAAFAYQNVAFRRYLDLPNDANFASLTRADNIVVPFSFVFIGLLIVIYIINGRWIYIAARDSGAGPDNPDRISAGWAVGWYFVPFANLIKPYQAMKEIWGATVGRATQSGENTPSWMLLWWLSWVALGLADRFISNMSNDANITPEDFLSFNNAAIIVGILWLIPAYLFLRLIREVTAATTNHYDRVFE